MSGARQDMRLVEAAKKVIPLLMGTKVPLSAGRLITDDIACVGVDTMGGPTFLVRSDGRVAAYVLPSSDQESALGALEAAGPGTLLPDEAQRVFRSVMGET